jgi:hypothetical protein
MWFYSIQGLFEVVFHYHKRDVQKDCLKLLAVGIVWLNEKKNSDKKNKMLWKESLNSDGQQFTTINKMNKFHSCQFIEHKKTATYADGNQGTDLGQALKCAGVLLVNGILVLPSW